MKRKIMTLGVLLMMAVSMMLMPVNALAAGKFMTVKSNVHLRSASNINDVITTLKKGTTVYFTGRKHKAFYEVKTSKGKVGYVFKMYLKDTDSKETGSVYRVKSNTCLYKKASRDSSRVCNLEENRYLLVVSVSDGWAYVRTANDKKGYVPTSVLKK